MAYPNIQQNFKDQDWLSHRKILASRNDVVEKLSVTIQKQLPGQEYAYKSTDCILNNDEAVQYPIEFLNSLQTPDLLCNGTRLIVKKLMQHVIQVTVLTGCAKAITINKPQDQSLGIAGIDLQTPCFSHGQLYVACSRVGKEENLFVHTPNGTTKNVVYHIALR
ncbi:ATP-dependent DNA helicase [Trichonephila clavipes]|nr:ATP-dependent DNA helicase [Trichonephila clavipes]